MEEKPTQAKDQGSGRNYKRRKVVKGGAAAGAAAAVPGTASAYESVGGKFPNASSPRGARTEVIEEGDNYKLLRTSTRERISLGKFYTDGPKESKLEIVALDDGNGVEALGEGNDAGVYRTSSPKKVATDEEAALSAVETSGFEVVNRTKDIDRTLDSCSQDYCDGFTYTHVQTGFSVDFTNHIDTLGKNTVTEVLSQLITIYIDSKKISRWAGGIVGIIAGTMLSIGTGSDYTVSPWDTDKGWIFTNPVVEFGVANGWDKHAHDLTNVQDNEREHIGALDGRCG